MEFDAWTSRIENHRPMPTELNEISTNEVSRGSYKAITIHITLGRDEFPQHCNTGAQQSNPLWSELEIWSGWYECCHKFVYENGIIDVNEPTEKCTRHLKNENWRYG